MSWSPHEIMPILRWPCSAYVRYPHMHSTADKNNTAVDIEASTMISWPFFIRCPFPTLKPRHLRNNTLLLVCGIPTPLKHMKVSWDHYSQYMENYPNVPNHQPVIGIILWVSPCSNTRHWHYKIWIQPATPATNGWRPLDAAGATIATPTRGLKLPPLARHRFRGTLRVELRWFLRKKGWFSALF
jgi:hypothetical protein